MCRRAGANNATKVGTTDISASITHAGTYANCRSHRNCAAHPNACAHGRPNHTPIAHEGASADCRPNHVPVGYDKASADCRPCRTHIDYDGDHGKRLSYRYLYHCDRFDVEI